MLALYENNPAVKWETFRKLLNDQSYDLITVEENARLNQDGLQSQDTKQARDQLCSNKIVINDLWVTPREVINDFFVISGLNRDDCFDPCASDGRWLDGKGWSSDILPMTNGVEQRDFLQVTKGAFLAKGV